ncbi:Uncharacterised protein [Enterobacter hormaechei]|nr:Uncharacterised protein [Enterobacter hormaechei]VAL19299.1 Uncharacterised protein [Enterobacter hormaechei]VAL72487.1 Uncharacterised protein [Enterobacter hormaechei]
MGRNDLLIRTFPNSCFSISIEEMALTHIKLDADIISGNVIIRRSRTDNQFMPTHGGIKHKFSPGQLSNADLRRDVFAASLCGENIFRTDPKDDRFALVTLRIQYGQLLLRDLQTQRFRHEVSVVDRATNEVHRR